MHNIISPYNFAAQLDEIYKSSEEGAFTSDEFISVAEAIQTVGNAKKQEQTFQAFKKLSKAEVIARSIKIKTLTSLLKTINNNAISSSPKTQK